MLEARNVLSFPHILLQLLLLLATFNTFNTVFCKLSDLGNRGKNIRIIEAFMTLNNRNVDQM